MQQPTIYLQSKSPHNQVERNFEALQLRRDGPNPNCLLVKAHCSKSSCSRTTELLCGSQTQAICSKGACHSPMPVQTRECELCKPDMARETASHALAARLSCLNLRTLVAFLQKHFDLCTWLRIREHLFWHLWSQTTEASASCASRHFRSGVVSFSGGAKLSRARRAPPQNAGAIIR